MGGNSSNSMMLIAIIVVIAGMMWYQSRQSKKQKGKVEDFRSNLKKGDQVATYSGLVGTIEEVDLDIDQVVINSEGSLSRWRVQAITEPPVVPNYVSDEEFAKEQAGEDSEPAADVEDKDQSSADQTVAEETATPEEPAQDDASAVESEDEANASAEDAGKSEDADKKDDETSK
ncbi:preprotein translocase subunit YajC [Bifidobacterium sp. SMB2]|uniref:Preprotein translocase subunit YajC n=1 Tax=Bifidobacterium saimiriisciurei TaxID=2661627 RepID=A0ABX0CCB9_9BIFI|nr:MULTISPECIES: preprotein translocase subunit YajC [Bifidobacterium]NEG96832.1 preprotein translocase subunit YajC [Bifidobacterium sp. SMB2]NEH12301.1 preprotein translocase subunit YajC [Bifidobacterium saimiriisciurei]